mgnify:CR=1 FL=1
MWFRRLFCLRCETFARSICDHGGHLLCGNAVYRPVDPVAAQGVQHGAAVIGAADESLADGGGVQGGEEVAIHSGVLNDPFLDIQLELDLPAYPLKQLEVTDQIVDALGARPREVWRARDLVCVFDDPRTVMELKPDLDKVKALKGALMQVTAPGTGTAYDCVSRTFAPKMGLPEDPVCGSGHCHIVPYWAQRLGKRELTARQASPRGGTLYCRLEGDRVLLAGRAALFSTAELMLEGGEP